MMPTATETIAEAIMASGIPLNNTGAITAHLLGLKRWSPSTLGGCIGRALAIAKRTARKA